ncbi:MAG TPA: addiction module protein [Gemmataceae bacterium]|nr:addiction module protein [Gemmataceae bacterium]
MPINVEAMRIARLTVAERLELIEQIWNSLPEGVEPGEVPPAHLAEFARWRAEAQAQPGVGKPWREVLGRLEPVS